MANLKIMDNIPGTIKVGDINVKKVYVGGTLVWPINNVDAESLTNYFYIEMVDSGSLYVDIYLDPLSTKTINSSFYDDTLYYSLNKSTWTPVFGYDPTTHDYDIDNSELTLTAGQKVYFRRFVTGASFTDPVGFMSVHFDSTARHKAGGNIQTLFENVPTLNGGDSSHYSFREMFSGDNGLISIKDLVFSAVTTIPDYCFYQMFYNCTSLTTNADRLHSINGLHNIGQYGFYQCFKGCSNLGGISKRLNCNTVEESGMKEMYAGTKITTFIFPNMLSVADLALSEICSGCTSLTTIQTTSGTSLCFDSIPGVSWLRSAFSGCTSLSNVPDNLFDYSTDSPYWESNYCYYGLFSGCSSLTSLKFALKNETNGNYAVPSTTNNMFTNWLPTNSGASILRVNSAIVSSVNAASATVKPSNWTAQAI